MVCDQPTAGYNLTLYLAPVEESQRSILYFMVPIFRWIGRAGGIPSSLLFVLSSRLLVWSLQVQLHHHTARLWGLFKPSRISVYYFFLFLLLAICMVTIKISISHSRFTIRIRWMCLSLKSFFKSFVILNERFLLLPSSPSRREFLKI